MEYIADIIQETLHSFDFAYCISVNVLTYVIVKAFDKRNKSRLKTWYKRLILLMSIILLGGVYYIAGTEIKILINSAILAPVSWSWIFKPLCSKFNIDYKKFNI